MNLSEVQYVGKMEGATALEQLPHVLEKICLLWGHAGFDRLTGSGSHLSKVGPI
jgi:hypothetical protein